MNAVHAGWSVFSGVDFEQGLVFDTTDAEEVESACAHVYGPHTLRPLSKDLSLRGRLERVPLGSESISLTRSKWLNPISIDPGALEDYYLLCLPVQGRIEYRHGRSIHHTDPSRLAIVGGGERFNFSTSACNEQIILRITSQAMDACWQGLSGEYPRTPIRFECLIDTHGRPWQAISPTMELMARLARSGFDEKVNRNSMARLEEMLMTSLLLNLPHNHLNQPKPPAFQASESVKKAKAHMMEHLEEPLTLATLSAALGIPGRTLQWAFQAAGEMGPMQWLRRQRLQSVRALLAAPSQGDNDRVSVAAMRFGFTHLGEFSQQYRRAFGETPSETLRRRPRGRA